MVVLHSDPQIPHDEWEKDHSKQGTNVSTKLLDAGSVESMIGISQRSIVLAQQSLAIWRGPWSGIARLARLVSESLGHRAGRSVVA